MRQDKKRVLCHYFLVLVSIGVAGWEATADDWPQWRGPNRDGISQEVVKAWSGNQPTVVWRKPIGEGFSAISVANGRAYTMDTDEVDEFVLCLDAKTGDEIWRVKSGEFYKEGQGGNGPRSTPTVDGDQLYTISAVEGRLLALKVEDGSIVWSVSLKADFGSKRPTWGYSMSPIVDGDRLITEVGGENSIAAFDKTDGTVLWRSSTYKLGYSSPIVVSSGGVKQTVFFTASGLVSLNPADGTRYWQYDWETSYNVNAATPVFIPDDQIFISSGYGTGAATVRIQPSGDKKFIVEELWRNKVMKNHFATVVAQGGYLYGFDNSILKCIEARTGKEVWNQRGYGKGSLMLARDQLIVLSDKGKLAIGKATPGGFKPEAEDKVLRGRCWTMPVLANGKLYLRSMSEVVCLNLSS